MSDPSVIAILIDALEKDPDNTSVRLHLATLLIESREYERALEQLSTLLAKAPTHQQALRMAAQAAELSGDKIRAHAYRQIYEGLGWNQAKGLIDSSPEPEGVSDSLPPSPPSDTPDRERVRVGADRPDQEEPPDLSHLAEKPTLSLDDVAGLESVKRRLNLAFLAPIRNPDMMKLYGRSLRGGLLLYGPPGCGKTFIARALAGEIGARFMSVGLSDVLDMWLGQSEKNLREIFETARRNRPCVLFFDEIDALGRKRSLMRQSAGRDVVNQLLAELDSLGANNEGLFILAATNHPWDVDNALRRPGRLDRTLLVTPPDPPAREAILRFNLRDRPTEKLDIASLSTQTDWFSGADVAHLVESAAELAMEDSLKTGNVRPITMNDFKKALKDVKPSTRAWLDTARNFALFSNDGGAYDDLVTYLRERKMM